MTRTDIAMQAMIFVLSVSAIWMIGDMDPRLARWGFVFGLASQPFWLIETWRKRQWGMLLLAVFYTGAWSQGIANHFFL